MYDARLVNTHFNEPTLLTGRFVGAGNASPTPVANVKDSAATRCTVTHGSVGNSVFTFTDTPLGTVQSYDFWVNSATNNKNCQVTPPAAGSYVFVCNVTYHANGASVDVVSSEEINFQIWTARTSQP
jgi:hypothetical protein